MAENKASIYEFGKFRLYEAQRCLEHSGRPVPLTPKGFDTLLILIRNRDRVLEKDELMKALWPGSFVEEGNLSQNIFLLRKALGDDQNGNCMIQTLPRKGYRFVATVRELASGNGLPAATASSPNVEYWTYHSPFRGLQVFEQEDAWLFFGRDHDTDELLVRMDRAPVLVVVGNSGSGKSSLVRAGLIPALHDGRFQSRSLQVDKDKWRIAIARPSLAPFDYLAEVLPAQLAPELAVKQQAEFIADLRNKLPEGGDALRNAVSALIGAAAKTAQPPHVLLVVDQFEEIFTLTSNSAARALYIDTLLAAARPESAAPVHLVLVLRADFYPHCLEHPGLSRCLERNLYNVPRMTHEQLREAIEKRLELAAAHAEPGLIDSLLEDVGSEPGDLALLEHALDQLWERSGGPGCTLTNASYAEIGRLRGALGKHADEVYEALGDEKHRFLARKIFLELVHLGEGAQDTRRRVHKEDILSLGEPGEVEPLLEQLASTRLISAGGEGEKAFVEVSHEALIREWPTLRDWLAQNREDIRLERRLLEAAGEWDSLKRDAGALLQGARLAQAEDWRAKRESVPVLVEEYLRASVAAREEVDRKQREAQERELAQQKNAARRLRWFSLGLTLMLLVAVGAAWFIYRQQVIQKSRALAAQSGELLPRDRGQALDMAIRSWGIAGTEEAHLAIAKAFPETLGIFKHDGLVVVTTFSPDGQRILSASFDHTARLWNTADGRLMATLRGHTDKLEDAGFSPDGTRIVTASHDKTARVWNSADGRLLFTLRGHTDKVWRATFSPDGRRILTASLDKTAKIWNSADGRLLATLQGHASNVTTARFSPDGQRIVTTSWDHTARVWGSADGALLRTLQHDAEVVYATFSPDSQRIVTGSSDKTARVWGSADGKLLFTLRHQGEVVSATYLPDGQRIVTASWDHTARVWNNVDGRLLVTFHHDGPVAEIAFSPDGRRIVTASYDRSARVWDAADGRLLAFLEGHANEVYHVEFSPSGDYILTGSGDGTARLWSTVAGRSLTILEGHTGHVTFAKFSSDSRRVVTASSDHSARVWNAGDGRLVLILQGHTDQLSHVTFSPDDQLIVTSGWDRTARVWNAVDGRLLYTLLGHTDHVDMARFSADGQRIVTAGFDHTARVWSAADGRLLVTLQGHSDQLLSAQFSPDGERILTASFDHTARVWSAADGRLLVTLQGHSDQLLRAQFSPDGERIVTASLNHSARLWNAADGRLLLTLKGHTGEVSYAQFSPDGQRIVTASLDNTARVWNSADGRLLAIFQCPKNGVRNALFSPDGHHIVTASLDNTARVWNSADGRLLAILQGHTDRVSAAFSPDGQRIVTASLDQTARIWQLLTLDDIHRILAK